MDEPNGDMTVTVQDGTGYAVGSISSASGTVTDDDATTVTLAGPAGDLEEGYSKTLSLSLSRALVNGEVLAVPLTFGAGTATRGTDYTIICTTRLPMGVTCNNLNTAASPTVTFTGPSAASVNLFLEGAYDTTPEPGGKTVDIGLALDASSGVNLGGGAVGVDNLEEFKIIDGIPPEVSISGVPADIFTTDPFTVTFTFSKLVDLGTQDLLVTGGAGSMFTKKGNVQYVEEYSLVVTPAGGEDVVVQVNRNGAQADNLVLGPPEAEIATARWNNAIPVFFSASRVEVTEGADSHAEVLVRLGTARPDETTIVALQYNGITAEKGADRDFVNGPGSVTIAAGETEATVRIPIIDDNAREGEESFAVNIPGEGLPRDSVLRLGSPPTVTVFITDDDEEALVFSPSAVTVDEGSSNTYTVKLATAPTGTVTVTVGGASGEVTVDTDSGSPGNQNSLSFSTTTWDTAQTVTVTAGEDVDITNDSATLTHTAAGGGYAGVTGNVAVTVTDDDTPTVSFAASSSTVAEDGGTKTIRINISPAPSSNIFVNYDVSGTATEGTDFSSIISFLLVPANLSSIDVPVVVTDDSVDENGETVILTLSDGTGYRVGSPSVHTLTIADNDGANNAPTVATVIPDQNATAGTAFSYQFPANTFADADGDPLSYSASQGDDSALPGWLSFTEGARSFSGTPQAANVGTVAVKVTATDGNGGSISDTFNIVVSAATPVTPTVPTVNFAAGSGAVAESGGTQNVAVSISPAPTAEITVSYAVSGSATAGSDFSITGSGTVTVAANIGSVNIPVVVTDDTTDESGETVILTLSSGTGYTVGSTNVHTLTITDNDGSNDAPTVATAIPDQAATAGAAFSYAFPANTFADADSDTLGYTATQGDDSALPTWLSFTDSSRTLSGTPQAANVGTLSVKVTATDGNGGSISDTFNIVVSAATPVTPTVPTVNFAAGSSTVAESGGTQNVAVSISPAPTAEITVSYAVSGSATAGSDFSITGSGTVTVAANTGSVNIPVVVTDDNVDESGETVILTLSSGTGYTVGSANVHTLTITDNDSAGLVFSPTSLTVAEGGSGNYTVRLATQPTGTVTVTVASNNTDVTVDTNSVSPGNQNSLSFTTTTWNTAQPVTVAAGEDVDTVNDSATLSHSASGGGYNSVTSNVTVTVTDDDTTPVPPPPTTPTVNFAAGSGAVAESGGTQNVAVSISPAPTVEITVSYAVSGSATAGSDFSITGSGTVTVAANIGSVNIPVVVTDDSVDENGETVILTLNTGTGYTVGSANVHTLTITDNDGANNAPTVATVIPDQSATAGAAFSYAFLANTFADADGDPLGYTATQGDDSALPGWLTFTEASRTFSGTPQSTDVGTLTVKVTASDGNGGSWYPIPSPSR